MLIHKSNEGMAFELRPLKLLTTAAFALHLISIFIMAMVTVLQVPLKNFYWLSHSPQSAIFVMPSLIFISTVALILVCHAVLATSFIKTLANEYVCTRTLSVTSIIALIFVMIAQPVIDNISIRINHFFIFRHGSDHAVEALTTMNMLYLVLYIRNIALLLLLIGASVSLYVCHVWKNKRSPYPEPGQLD